jgi:membrane fusion protein (multidrug efflux system)
VGQRVQAGAPLMTIVPLDDLWVDANFKENQLRYLRIGQRATLVADLYGRRIEYHGTVAGLGAGTGAAFSLLPAQNATGNWVKVVQRVPVRIVLNADEVAAHPLRVGLSMQVSVDASDPSGKALTEEPRQRPVASTQVFDDHERDVDQMVHRIIMNNIGRAAERSGPRQARMSAAR